MRTSKEIKNDITATKMRLAELYTERTELINYVYSNQIATVAEIATQFDMRQPNVSAVIKNNTTD